MANGYPYVIVGDANLMNFSVMVNGWCDKGYAPAGGVTKDASSGLFLQAMYNEKLRRLESDRSS